MTKRKALLLAPLIALLPIVAAGTASAADGATVYRAHLDPVPLNGQNKATATVTLVLRGNRATITEHASGLAKTFMGQPFPHVQHIHGMGGQGVCPTASADKNGDGLITTTEGGPAYGQIDTTLSTSGDTSPAAGTNIKTAPSGSSFSYHRTITLSAQTLSDLRNGKAHVVIHGLDPATAPKAATTTKSELVPSLPQAATAPALCGKLLVSPSGSVDTGGAAGHGPGSLPLGLAGGVLLLGAGGALTLRRRVTSTVS